MDHDSAFGSGHLEGGKPQRRGKHRLSNGKTERPGEFAAIDGAPGVSATPLSHRLTPGKKKIRLCGK